VVCDRRIRFQYIGRIFVPGITGGFVGLTVCLLAGGGGGGGPFPPGGPGGGGGGRVCVPSIESEVGSKIG
jgi:hypothetical protein